MSEEKTTTIPKFDGKDEKYDMWKTKFRSWCNLNKCGAAIKKDFESPDTEDTEYETPTEEQKKLIKNRDMNTKAMHGMTISFQKESLMNIIHKTASDKYPSGIAWKTMEALEMKYRPDDDTSKIEKTTALNKIEFKEKDDPLNGYLAI